MDDSHAAPTPSEVELLRAELAELRETVARLSARAAPTVSQPPAAAVEPSAGRRGFLRLAGAAAVGATAASIAGSSGRVAALTGEEIIIGAVNGPTNAGQTTILRNPSVSVLSDVLFDVQNASSTIVSPPGTFRVGIAGSSSGTDAVGYRVGVYGRSSSPSATPGGAGVIGSADGPEHPFVSSKIGVVGTAAADGLGVFGYLPTGVGSMGVLGRADQGYGVVASSLTGVSLWVRDGGRLLQQPRPTLGAPTTGSFFEGEMIRDTIGDMYLCIDTGAPGTWRKVTAQHPAYPNAGGSINLLPKPIRIVDSRGNGAPITNGSEKLTPGVPLQVQVTGTVADGLSVPTGAKGILGNITATEANGGGFAVVWPNGLAQPQTSNLNYSLTTGTPAIANYFISAIDVAGKMNVMCAAAATHILIDVFGFVY